MKVILYVGCDFPLPHFTLDTVFFPPFSLLKKIVVPFQDSIFLFHRIFSRARLRVDSDNTITTITITIATSPSHDDLLPV